MNFLTLVSSKESVLDLGMGLTSVQGYETEVERMFFCCFTCFLISYISL